MPPIIKKQIRKAQRGKSLSGYIKLVPLLFFICFLIIGWLISLAALKIFKSASSDNHFCISEVPTVLAGEGESGCESCASSCGSSCMADQAGCGSSFGCGEGCDSGDRGGGCGEGNCVNCGCWQ